MTALQRKYFGKRSKKRSKKRRSTARRTHVAKRRKSRGRRRSSGRRTHHRRRGRRGGGGGGYALKPGREDLKLMAATAAVGFLEGKAKSGEYAFLAQIPKPVAQLGFTGNIALLSWVASHFLKNPWLRLFARGSAMVTTYQIGRMGSVFSDGSAVFSVSGGSYDDDDIARAVAAAQGMNVGALQADGGDTSDAMSWDSGVTLYGGG
jgi:hypothetical protein